MTPDLGSDQRLMDGQRPRYPSVKEMKADKVVMALAGRLWGWSPNFSRNRFVKSLIGRPNPRSKCATKTTNSPGWRSGASSLPGNRHATPSGMLRVRRSQLSSSSVTSEPSQAALVDPSAVSSSPCSAMTTSWDAIVAVRLGTECGAPVAVAAVGAEIGGGVRCASVAEKRERGASAVCDATAGAGARHAAAAELQRRRRWGARAKTERWFAPLPYLTGREDHGARILCAHDLRNQCARTCLLYT